MALPSPIWPCGGGARTCRWRTPPRTPAAGPLHWAPAAA
uniref:Uncharacterized protein n=1 Tax=Arundo donax TaxID=35708 RepID=A0A0A8YZ70_ARUDO